MNKQVRGLGRGLDALIPTTEVREHEQVDVVAVKDIIPNKFQPRRIFDEEALLELSRSIQQYGLLQPIVVRKLLNGYELVAGERRWRASKQAGLTIIPAVIREYTDAEMTEIALIENLQRENLNAIEEAVAYRRLMDDFGLTQEEVSRKIGRSRSHIANFVRLLNLPSIVQDFVSRGTLSMGQARPILALDNTELQVEAAEIIIAEDMSARDAEALVKRLAAAPRKAEESTPAREIFVVEAEDRLKLVLGTQVKIKPGKLKSKIEIEFYSAEDLDRIIEVLTEPQVQAAAQKRNNLVV
ncbi:ParB/RepB/Spo0J family partition protein|uniref:Chromosome partitioning protein, ParB family n=1 Tax=Dendrosporobacter quercicolus TaxID=146817 RepID=A0A1G9XW62_9FIRM|nr:ParB/RepB/Spo0J family partition protein [Dendrosporobacter quercicolus]NSL49063.1 ParB/RepB/Spo0J family partition protein [Dendrosporobacter quercicolus DSM 1736]SDN01038.1 chromosome partitioning protein, ParB family [Dendrosporobacter quercicolus]